MQRVFEIQSNWDEREKLRQFSVARPPVRPPWPIIAPAYQPDSVTRVPSNESIKNKANNSGPGLSFLQSQEKAKKNKSKLEQLIQIEQSLKKEILEIKNGKNEFKKPNLTMNNNQGQKLILDYDKKAKEIYQNLENTNKIEISSIKKMIEGKNNTQIDSLITILKNHPEIIKNEKTKLNAYKIDKNPKVQEKMNFNEQRSLQLLKFKESPFKEKFSINEKQNRRKINKKLSNGPLI
jgi:hypothetical protein